VDLDGERHALLQLFGLLIEVLAKLSDGDSFLQKKKKKNFKKRLNMKKGEGLL